jgi:hypothetical protein
MRNNGKYAEKIIKKNKNRNIFCVHSPKTSNVHLSCPLYPRCDFEMQSYVFY